MVYLTSASAPTEESVRQALAQWEEHDDAASPLSNLLLWRQAFRHADGSTHNANQDLLRRGLTALAQEQPDQAELLHLRFIEGESGQQAAIRLHLSEGSIWRKQRDAIARLTALLQEMERAAHGERLRRVATHLETPTYTHLLGAAAHLEALTPQLAALRPPWLVTITGIGGIGKTALADALTRQQAANEQWSDIGWVTARQEIFNGGGAIEAVEQPALSADALVDALAQQLLSSEVDPQTLSFAQKSSLLQQRLRSEPHLVVIDNLETLTDVKSLLATLRQLANPTKFLITSRISRIFEGDIYHFVVPELARNDALALLRQEAAVRNAPGLADASDAELQPILETVGGNPLALRLVVGQLQAHPLNRVLDDLRQARGRQATEIYTYIYRRAWSDLDEQAQQVLLLMPLVTESGGDLEYLTAMASAGGLSAGDVGDALVHLISRNLVDSRGDLHQRRYTIHSLTRAFLQQEILRWPAPDSEAPR